MPLTEYRQQGADLGRLRSDQQRRFVLEYLIDFKPKAAAIRAGYSPRSAHVTAQKLLNHDVIKAYLGKVQRLDAERLELDRLEVLRQLWNALTRKVRDFAGPDGIPLRPDELPEECQSIVDGYKVRVLKRWVDGEDGPVCELQSIEYKLTPHATAREQAMKHKGLFAPDKLDVSGEVLLIPWDELMQGGPERANEIEGEILKIEVQGNGKANGKGGSDE